MPADCRGQSCKNKTRIKKHCFYAEVMVDGVLGGSAKLRGMLRDGIARCPLPQLARSAH